MLADLTNYRYREIRGSDTWFTYGQPRHGLEQDTQAATECYLMEQHSQGAVDCYAITDVVRFACTSLTVEPSVNKLEPTTDTVKSDSLPTSSSGKLAGNANTSGRTIGRNSNPCPPDWTPMKYSGYTLNACIKELNYTGFYNKTETWIRTQRMCVNEGGQLFWAENDVEIKWFLDYFNNLTTKFMVTIRQQVVGSFYLYLDLHKQLYCGNEWCWRSRIPIKNDSLIRWYVQQPKNASNFDCAYYKYINNYDYMRDNNGLHGIACDNPSDCSILSCKNILISTFFVRENSPGIPTFQ